MSKNPKKKKVNISSDVKPFNPNNNENNNNNIKELNEQNKESRGEISHNPLISQNIKSNEAFKYGYSNNKKISYNDNYINTGSKKNSINNLNNNIVNKRNKNYNNNNDILRSRPYNNTDINMSNNNRYPNLDNNNNRNSNRYNHSMMQQLQSQSQYQDNNNSMHRSGNNAFNNSNQINNIIPAYFFHNNNMNMNNQAPMSIEPQGGRSEQRGEEPMSTNRHYNNSKSYRGICIHAFIAFIVVCLALGALVKFWEPINQFFSEMINKLNQLRNQSPSGSGDSETDFFSEFQNYSTRQGSSSDIIFSNFVNFFSPFIRIFGILLVISFGFKIIISSIFTTFTATFLFFYITFPLILLVIILKTCFERCWVRKTCEKIYKNILNYLKNEKNNGRMNMIYEYDIYIKCAESTGISRIDFDKKCLPILKQIIQRQNSNISTGQQFDYNGRSVVYWYLNN
jgi:hypothetical protein